MNIETLKLIAQAEAGYAFIDPEEGAELVTAGMVELNDTMVDDHGGVAARLTESGKWEVANANIPVAVTDTVPFEEQVEFVETVTLTEKEIEDYSMKNIVPVETTDADFAITKGGFTAPARKVANRKSKFPFDDLEVGDSFFVEGKTAAKVASTVTAANKRFSEATTATQTYKFKGEERTRPVRVSTRKFAAVDEGTGVRIGRTI